MDNQHETITRLQSMLMHLQNDLQQMSDVVCAQEQEIKKLRAEVAFLREKHEQREADALTPVRDPFEERPPHY